MQIKSHQIIRRIIRRVVCLMPLYTRRQTLIRDAAVCSIVAWHTTLRVLRCVCHQHPLFFFHYILFRSILLRGESSLYTSSSSSSSSFSPVIYSARITGRLYNAPNNKTDTPRYII